MHKLKVLCISCLKQFPASISFLKYFTHYASPQLLYLSETQIFRHCLGVDGKSKRADINACIHSVMSVMEHVNVLSITDHGWTGKY